MNVNNLEKPGADAGVRNMRGLMRVLVDLSLCGVHHLHFFHHSDWTDRCAASLMIILFQDVRTYVKLIIKTFLTPD